MQKRKRVVNPELLAKVRSLGCVVCSDERKPQTYITHAHHIKSRGASGDDTELNLLPLCALHHRLIHSQGLTTFSRKHRVIWDLLLQMGWELNEVSGKWFGPSSSEPH